MSFINKQKFLTELGRLLTFMQEEDKETTLAMYGKMFDLVQNEEMLSSLLISPTRQAVRLARVYDSAFNGEEAVQEGEDETAPYIVCIKEVFNEVLDKMPDAESEETENGSNEQEKETLPAAETVPESPELEKSEAVAAPVEAVEAAEVVSQNVENAQQVDDFLKDFKIENNALDEEKEEESEPAPVEKKPEEIPVKKKEKARVEDADEDADSETPVEKKEEKPAGKLSGGALVLFLVIAIPITAVGIILDISMALGFLSVSAAGFLMTFRILGAAFASFRVFADVLVVTGTGFVLGAISFLFLWTSIWLAFHVSVKMVSGIINLAIKICTKGDTAK